MNKYFVISDTHGFYFEMKKALNDKGFDKEDPSHYLILLGDAFDRGNRNIDCYNFFCSLGDRLIYIRGNHEDLLLECYKLLINKEYIPPHHYSNGTVKTLAEFLGIPIVDLQLGIYEVEYIKSKLEPLLSFINKSINYYELNDYIFVHGWVPYYYQDGYDPDQGENEFSCVMTPIIQLDTKDENMWALARWYNGMHEFYSGITIKDKTIVCGHWNTSYGWANKYPDKYVEFKTLLGSKEECFDIYKDTINNSSIIAMDACTAHTKRVNVFVICA